MVFSVLYIRRPLATAGGMRQRKSVVLERTKSVVLERTT